MPMHMYVYFDPSCAFVFKSWSTTINEDGMFALGCILTTVYCFLHMGITFVKDWYLQIRSKKSGSTPDNCPIDVRVALGVYYFIYTLSNFFIMMIMMTMNGYVLIAIACGLTVGYWIFQGQKSLKELSGMHEMCHS